VASALRCPRCRHENPPGAKFCIECASPLHPACGRCGTRLPALANHLAERLLDSRAALEGERKQVTKDVREARALLDAIA